MKCIVYNCPNHKSQGEFLGDLCVSCWSCITSASLEKHRYSQVWRNIGEANAREKDRIGKIKEAFNTIEKLTNTDYSNNAQWYKLVQEMTK
jgi:hypothetical protein